MKPNSTRCPSLSIAGILGESSRCVGRALTVLCAREAWALQQTTETREEQALRARAKPRRDYNRPTWVDEGVGRGLGERCVGSCEKWAKALAKGATRGNQSGERSARAATDDDVRMQYNNKTRVDTALARLRRSERTEELNGPMNEATRRRAQPTPRRGQSRAPCSRRCDCA